MYSGYSENIAVDTVFLHYTTFAGSQATRVEWSLNKGIGILRDAGQPAGKRIESREKSHSCAALRQ